MDRTIRLISPLVAVEKKVVFFCHTVLPRPQGTTFWPHALRGVELHAGKVDPHGTPTANKESQFGLNVTHVFLWGNLGSEDAMAALSLKAKHHSAFL